MKTMEQKDSAVPEYFILQVPFFHLSKPGYLNTLQINESFCFSCSRHSRSSISSDSNASKLCDENKLMFIVKCIHIIYNFSI